jgi:LPS sulfotransferase NodH
MASHYFVCATPRSGSTLLCEALTETGIAGRPREYFEALRGTDLPRQPQEYFSPLPADVEALLPRFAQRPDPQLADYAAYLDDVRAEATTPNGVFAAKLMWGYFGEFVARLRELPAYAHAGGVLETMDAAFPGARYVEVLRRGKVEQAVSLWTAIQTQSWRAGDGGAALADPVYHRGALEHLVSHLAEHERAWSAFFDSARVRPLVVVYEDLVADWEPTLRRVLAFLEIEGAEDVELPRPPLARQSDDRSRAWVERYLLEVGGAAEADVAG